MVNMNPSGGARSERSARILAYFLLGGLILLIAAALYFRGSSGAVTLSARIPEAGGWNPADLSVEAGQPLRLRLVSEDVVHGFALGQSDLPGVDLLPGKVEELTLTFDAPGKYTYYCTRWCGVNHWRMRGVIEVTGAGETAAQPVQPPLYVTLGINLDEQRHAENLPARRPSAAAGAALNVAPPERTLTWEYYAAHAPDEVWADLRAEASLNALSDQEIWDVVALLWQAQTSAEELTQGRALYADNCAACHGANGAGDGPFAAQMPENAMAAHGHSGPVNFTDAEHLLVASPARLQGKTIRGGMGTSMPYWGPIFTDAQTWALVEYLWTFQFDYALEDTP
ncbi:MAG: c-type cytochrome [Chloroflexi bacterium]|nr:c-type cytochrome [Chloroflexota bacterium]